MALGDGIRRNIRTVSAQERERFRAALLALQGRIGLGVPAPPHSADALYWFDEDEIRRATAAHHGPAFLPWHRELCNRFEQMLRDVDPELSLHYWDWNEDPHELFTPTFMSRAGADAPYEGLFYGQAWAPEDSDILKSESFRRMSTLLESKHDAAHFVYFGGTFVNAHISLHDPAALLLHSNVDRLFAMWQAEAGQAWRLDPSQVYGSESAILGTTMIESWTIERSRRPWLPVEGGGRTARTFAHPSVVAPPCYDTIPTRIAVDRSANPGRVINFNDVYAGKTFARAASFQVFGCGNVHFVVTSGPTGPYAVITPGGAVTAAHSPDLYQEARIWFGFTGTTPYTTAPPGEVTIRCRETGEDFVFLLQGNTIPLPAAAAPPPPDRTGSLPGPAGRSHSATVTWTWTWKPAGG
jgi:hypothetical protein